MKNILIALLLVLPVLAWAGDTTTVYLIRHTEKDLTIKKDPPLIDIGLLRAAKWSEVFAKTKLDAVYSTDTQRTRDTASPTAKAQALEIQLYDPAKIDHQALLKKHAGQTILVVGHSNTTPQFVNSLIKQERYQDIDESEHNRLYQVVATGKHRHSQLLLVDPDLD